MMNGFPPSALLCKRERALAGAENPILYRRISFSHTRKLKKNIKAMKRIYLSFVILFSFVSYCFSQSNVTYTYDASGNRISRSIAAGSKAKGAFIYDSTPTNINQISESSKVTVSPTSKAGVYFLNISAELTGSLLQVYNSKGMKILEEEIRGNSAILNLGQYPKDVYLISVRSDSQTYTRKIISK